MADSSYKLFDDQLATSIHRFVSELVITSTVLTVIIPGTLVCSVPTLETILAPIVGCDDIRLS